MKPYVLKILDNAYHDIENISDYIYRESPKNAIDFTVGLQSVFDNLEYFPNIGKNLHNGVQAKVYKNHYILYDVDKNKRVVEILRIVHVSNFPEYQDLF